MHPSSKPTHHHHLLLPSSVRLPTLETIAMRGKVRITFLLLAVALLAFFHFHLRLSGGGTPRFGLSNFSLARPSGQSAVALSYAIREAGPVPEETIDAAVSILFPAWELLVVAPPGMAGGRDWHCVFQNNATSPATLAGALPFTNRTMFKCELPPSVRRLRPFYQPALARPRPSEGAFPARGEAAEELFRWNFLAYESLSTEDDVVLFVKGVNNRQGINRSPGELRCVFGDDPATAVRTAVTSSAQEIFRCAHPKLPAANSVTEIETKITLEVARENR
ncbi:hypothetical protein NL676_027488 [Syzygium grande]|nr:hypothetical protein NL676_027488 [Syzygium grande]